MGEERERTCVERAIEAMGGHHGAAQVLANAMAVRKQQVSMWRQRGWIPPKYADVVQRVTGGRVSAKSVLLEARRKMDGVDE